MKVLPSLSFFLLVWFFLLGSVICPFQIFLCVEFDVNGQIGNSECYEEGRISENLIQLKIGSILRFWPAAADQRIQPNENVLCATISDSPASVQNLSLEIVWPLSMRNERVNFTFRAESNQLFICDNYGTVNNESCLAPSLEIVNDMPRNPARFTGTFQQGFLFI